MTTKKVPVSVRVKIGKLRIKFETSLLINERGVVTYNPSWEIGCSCRIVSLQYCVLDCAKLVEGIVESEYSVNNENVGGRRVITLRHSSKSRR